MAASGVRSLATTAASRGRKLGQLSLGVTIVGTVLFGPAIWQVIAKDTTTEANIRRQISRRHSSIRAVGAADFPTEATVRSAVMRRHTATRPDDAIVRSTGE